MSIYFCQRTRLGDVAVFENRQPATAVKFITKSSLFILLLGVIRRLKLKLNSEKKLRIYSSPRHIAKPPVGGRFLSSYDFLNICLTITFTIFSFSLASKMPKFDCPQKYILNLSVKKFLQLHTFRGQIWLF